MRLGFGVQAENKIPPLEVCEWGSARQRGVAGRPVHLEVEVGVETPGEVGSPTWSPTWSPSIEKPDFQVLGMG